jgi:hypothetical protein
LFDVGWFFESIQGGTGGVNNPSIISNWVYSHLLTNFQIFKIPKYKRKPSTHMLVEKLIDFGQKCNVLKILYIYFLLKILVFEFF